MNINDLKNKILNHEDLNQEESLFLFSKIMNGDLNDIELSALLIGLRMKGETKDEIIGAVKIMRNKSLKIYSKACHEVFYKISKYNKEGTLQDKLEGPIKQMGFKRLT